MKNVLKPKPKASGAAALDARGYARSRRSGRRNPQDEATMAAEGSEGFHGRPVEEVKVLEDELLVHNEFGELGELEKLVVKALNGNTVELTGFDGALLCMSPDRSQLYIMGGDQRVDIEEFGIDSSNRHESELLGEVKLVVYYTTKKHLGEEGGEANYKHKFGEESGVMPYLVYDTVNELLSFAGGNYSIPNEGIRD